MIGEGRFLYGAGMALSFDALREKIGTEIGVSDWVSVTQDMINGFADVTDDHQFIHVDPEQAKATPFGGTIAHGFLTLSLLPALISNIDVQLKNTVTGVNYGFDRVRLIAPVPSGSDVRGRFVLQDAVEKRPGQYLLTFAVSVEIKGQDKPALTAEWLGMQFTDEKGGAA